VLALDEAFAASDAGLPVTNWRKERAIEGR
jgi:hypothetical protein